MDSCLPQSDLERFACGSLENSAAAELQTHLDHCSACRERLERFQEEQALVADVRRVLASGDEGACDDATAGLPEPTNAKHLPRIDGYRIIDVLGQGGMGIVYRAIQTRLNRSVALKVLPAMVGSANPGAVARFRREATAAARLHHTNIIPIYDFGESTDAHYCTMELVSGQPLNVVIKRFAESNASAASPARLADLLQSIAPGFQPSESGGSDHERSGSDVGSGSAGSSIGRGRLYFRQVARWMADAADALHYAHGEGIIHRDVKPSNLILSTDGRIMIADFGLAKDVNEQSVTLTGSLLGTLRYMSPEQAMAKRMRVDHRTDIYSLGTTMYELLTFQPAVPGADDKEILGHIITKDPVSPRKIVSTVPRDLETICLKAMEKSPESRYDTARALAEDLRRFINDLPVIAKQPGPIARTIKFVKRRRALVTAVTAVTLLFAATGLLMVERRARRIATIDRLMTEGSEFMRAHDWTAATDRFDQALRLDARDLRALNNQAILLKERFNNAIDPNPQWLADANDWLDRAIALYPNDAQIWSDKGVILKKLDRLPEARKAYDTATRLDPNNAAAWINLGIADAHQRDLDAAVQHLTRATELVDIPYTRNYAWRTLATVQLVSNDMAAAADSLERAKDADINDIATHLLSAKLQLRIGDLSAAISAANTVDTLSDGREPRAERILAQANLAKGEYASAIDAATAALDDSDFPTFNHLILAAAHAQSGNYAAAREHLARADDTWPDALKSEDAILPSSPAGLLWFETHAQLARLQQITTAALQAASP